MKAPEVTTIRAGNTQRVSAQHGCRSTSRRGTASLSHWRCVSTTGPDLPQDLTESHSAQRLCHQTTVDLSFAKNKNGYVPGISQFDLDAHIARLERVFPLARERLRDVTLSYCNTPPACITSYRTNSATYYTNTFSLLPWATSTSPFPL
jgi:hypothetical protein